MCQYSHIYILSSCSISIRTYPGNHCGCRRMDRPITIVSCILPAVYCLTKSVNPALAVLIPAALVYVYSRINPQSSFISEADYGRETNKVAFIVFLDVSQTFDKMWHTGLLFKIGSVLDSYLRGRKFKTKHCKAVSQLISNYNLEFPKVEC